MGERLNVFIILCVAVFIMSMIGFIPRQLFPVAVLVALFVSVICSASSSSAPRSYRRIEAWLRKNHGVSFMQGTPPGSIRIRLESVYEKEMLRLKSDIESGKMVGYRGKKLDAERYLKGFKGFIEKQDYSVFRE